MKKAKKFIYLISPNKIINNKFYFDLFSVFKSKKILFFQLRLKKENPKKIINIGKKIKKICNKFNVKSADEMNIKTEATGLNIYSEGLVTKDFKASEDCNITGTWDVNVSSNVWIDGSTIDLNLPH